MFENIAKAILRNEHELYNSSEMQESCTVILTLNQCNIVNMVKIFFFANANNLFMFYSLWYTVHYTLFVLLKRNVSQTCQQDYNCNHHWKVRNIANKLENLQPQC